MRLNLYRTGCWQSRTLCKEVGEHLIVDYQLIVEDHAHAISLHPDFRSIPLARRLVGLDERELSCGFRGIIPESPRALLAAVRKITCAIGVPDLYLWIGSQVDAAIGTRQRQHPLDEQFKIGVIAVGREKYTLPVACDDTIFHAPVRNQIAVPHCLPQSLLFGRAFGILLRIEVRSASPSGESLPIKQRHKARRRLSRTNGGSHKSQNE